MDIQNLSKKEQNIEVVKFLKSPSVKKIITKLNNIYETIYKRFEEKYEWDESTYEANEMTKSKKAMLIEKLNFYKEIAVFFEKEDNCIGREITLREINRQVDWTKSQIYNRVTWDFGESMDTASFTEDDLEHFRMLHMKDIHYMLISWINPRTEEEIHDWIETKYDIYEDPEQYFSDED